ncbi:MAG TPA: hypothetical protein VHG09_09680 [Longimicrobiales bacterium]|nr:hypothetical protein [Longimicrobiales bacterium]
MVRELAYTVVFGAVLSGAAAGQQSVGVTAVILERVEAAHVDVEVRSVGGRLELEQSESPVRRSGTRVLQHTYVGAGALSGMAEAKVPYRVGDGSALRLERRRVQLENKGEEVLQGEPLIVEAAGQLIVTRVLAANS